MVMFLCAMEEMSVNAENDDSVDSNASQKERGTGSSDRKFYRAVVLCLGLLSVFLLVGLLRLGFHYHDFIQRSAAELSLIRANLTEHLQTGDSRFSLLTKDRDPLNARITEMVKELERLQSLSKQERTCPAGWRGFSCSCYLLSSELGTWDQGRDDCRRRGADLVVVDSYKERMFVSEFSDNKHAWIGLNDREKEGTWKWIDGAPLTLRFWGKNHPDNGGGDPQRGEEDCVHIFPTSRGSTLWNDASCEASLQWICEKTA